MLIIDEAHSLPASTVEQIVSLSALESNRETVLQIILAGQPSRGGVPALPKSLDERLATRARLLPLERDECERYVSHRLTIAGGAGVSFSARALEVDLRPVRRRTAAGQPARASARCRRARPPAFAGSNRR